MDNSSGSSAGRNSTRLANMVLLRLVVSGYLAYLGVSMMWDQIRESSTLLPWLAWVAGPVFLIGGLVFGIYSWRQYRTMRREAEQKAAAESAEEPKDPEP